MRQSELSPRELLSAKRGSGRLRVCHLGKFYPPASGGMEAHVRTLALAQAEAGAEVEVICINHLDQQGQDVTWRPFVSTMATQTWDGPVRVTRLSRWASLARLEVTPGLLGALRRVQEARLDVFHLHTPNPTMVLALALTRTLVPVVIT